MVQTTNDVRSAVAATFEDVLCWGQDDHVRDGSIPDDAFPSSPRQPAVCGAHSLCRIAVTSEGSRFAVSGVRFDRSFLKRQSGSRGQLSLHDCYCGPVVRKDPSKAPCKGEMDLTPTPRLK